MLYENLDFRGSYKRAGKNKRRRLVRKQLAWVLVHDREAVINAFEDAGFPVEEDADAKKLLRILRKALRNREDKRMRMKARKLLKNLAIIILANKKEKASFANFMNADGDEASGAKAGDKAKKDSFLQKNAGALGEIAGGILGGVLGGKGVDNDINSMQNRPSPEQKKSNTGLIIGLGVAGLLAIGATVYFIRKSKK